jgi:hypothetical protein
LIEESSKPVIISVALNGLPNPGKGPRESIQKRGLYMLFFIAVGLLSLIFGGLFIFSPEYLRRINEGGMRLVSSIDTAILNYRIGIGATLVIASLLFFFVAYYISVKG